MVPPISGPLFTLYSSSRIQYCCTNMQSIIDFSPVLFTSIVQVPCSKKKCKSVLSYPSYSIRTFLYLCYSLPPLRVFLKFPCIFIIFPCLLLKLLAMYIACFVFSGLIIPSDYSHTPVFVFPYILQASKSPTVCHFDSKTLFTLYLLRYLKARVQ